LNIPPTQTDADDGADPSLPVLDAAWVIRDMGQDAEGYAELVGIFLEDVPATLNVLAGIEGGVVSDALLALIHEACNSMGVIGARRGAAQMHALERRLRRGEQMSAAQVAASASTALSSAQSAIQAWLAGPSGRPGP
jgi:HPt (histidine-containing phosphotransfer) domain-containing protein